MKRWFKLLNEFEKRALYEEVLDSRAYRISRDSAVSRY